MKKILIVIGVVAAGLVAAFVVYRIMPESHPQSAQIESSTVPTTDAHAGGFIAPKLGDVLSIGTTTTIQWTVPKKYEEERYSFSIYLINASGQKVSTSSILYWNYAKNGETSSDWDVGTIPFADKTVSPGTYTLQFEYMMQDTTQDASIPQVEGTFTSPAFMISAVK